MHIQDCYRLFFVLYVYYISKVPQEWYMYRSNVRLQLSTNQFRPVMSQNSKLLHNRDKDYISLPKISTEYFHHLAKYSSYQLQQSLGLPHSRLLSLAQSCFAWLCHLLPPLLPRCTHTTCNLHSGCVRMTWKLARWTHKSRPSVVGPKNNWSNTVFTPAL